MKPVNLYSMYEIGHDLHALDRFGSADVPAVDIFFPLHQARSRIHFILSDELVRLGLAKPAAIQLQVSINRIFTEYFTEQGGGIRFPTVDAPPIPSYQMYGIRESLRVFETVLAAEMQAAPAYIVPERGGHNPDTLVNGVENILGHEVSSLVSEKSKADFQASAKCLAFSLYTAAGFHACRAVESTMEEYYQYFSKKNDTLNGWQHYIDSLQKVIKDQSFSIKPNQRTLDLLKHTKFYDRNPVAHPRLVLDETEALILFRSAANLISTMIIEMKNAHSIALPAPAAAN